MSRVFHVDPHPIARLGLARLLDAHPSLALLGSVSEIAHAASRLPMLRPDLIVTEVAFPDGGGLSFLHALKELAPEANVLVLTDQDERFYAERCLRAGANGYLHKTSSEVRLLDGIEAAIRGDVVVSETLAGHMLRRAAAGGSNTGLSPVELLSDRELEVFEMIGSGMTTRLIAGRMQVSPKTVESHKARIKEKTGSADATQLLTLAVSWRLMGAIK